MFQVHHLRTITNDEALDFSRNVCTYRVLSQRVAGRNFLGALRSTIGNCIWVDLLIHADMISCKSLINVYHQTLNFHNHVTTTGYNSVS